MTQDWNKVKRVFNDAIEVEPRQRGAFLDQACGDDAGLRERVESLLRADEVSDEILPQPETSANAGTPARRIGKYRLRKLIGEGGMGVVYLAEQEHPRRDVALKIVKGTISPALRLRFHREARLLGRLQHPGIAQIYDAGTEPAEHGDGDIPFFAMEHVAGVPITDYANERSLSLRDRLDLIRRVAEALAHAHQKGVMHRDLKPANILVGEDGGPRILDFGIARATEDDDATYTRPGQLIGTPPYMSPEQCEGDAGRIDTRTDIYSLGAVAYELLVGRAPFECRGTLSEISREIRHREPPPPGSIDRSLRGDIEAILSRAMAKDPERRYPDASELAADIQRFLAHEPVHAVAPSATYRARKWVARYPAVSASVAAIFVILVVSLSIITRLYFDADRARIVSQQEMQRTNRTFDYFADMLSSINPQNYERNVAFETVLDATTEKVSRHFEGVPDLEARVRGLIGSIYLGLGRDEDAEEHLLASVARSEEATGGDDLDPDVLTARFRLAALHRVRNEHLEAEKLLRDVLAMRRRALGPDHEDTLLAQATLADFLQEISHPDGMPALREAVDTHVATLGRDHVDTARIMRSLGWYLHHANGESTQGERLLTEAHATLSRELGENHPDTIRALESLTYVLFQSERPVEARDTMERVHAAKSRRFGPDHPATLQTAVNRGMILVGAENSDAGIAMAQQSLRRMRDLHGSNRRPQILFALSQLADIVDREERGKIFAEWQAYVEPAPFDGPLRLPAQRVPLVGPDDAEDCLFGRFIDTDGARAVIAWQAGAVIHTRTGESWQYTTTLETPPSDTGSVNTVAVHGDLALVGWIDEPAIPGAPGRNRVFVYHRGAGDWSRAQEIVMPDTSSHTLRAMAIDATHVAIGMSGHRSDASGSVHVLRRDDDVLTRETVLTAEGIEDSKDFGSSVSIADRILVVGSPASDRHGRVVVYQHDGETWRADDILLPDTDDDRTSGLRFGWSVASDGVSIVVGAPSDHAGAREAGSATIYRRDGKGWRKHERLQASDAAAGDSLGAMVSIAGDVVILGATRDDQAGLDNGAAYLFRREGRTWCEKEKLLPEDCGWNAGSSRVAIHGRNVLLGAPRAYGVDRQCRTGAVYAFTID